MIKFSSGAVILFLVSCAFSAFMINGCAETMAAQPPAPQSEGQKGVLQGVKPVAAIRLTAESGLPMQAFYYNLPQAFKGVTYRLGIEFPSARGWKQSLSNEMTILTASNISPDVKWQRIAVFKGRLDKNLRPVPGSEKDWTHVVVYRVKAS